MTGEGIVGEVSEVNRKRAESGDIRLVLADVDGTLVNSQKALTPRALKVVRMLSEREIVFAITSGRPPRGLSPVIGPLELSTPVAAFNGGMFVQPDLAVIAQSLLQSGVAHKAVELIGHHGMDAWVYRGTDWYIPDREGPHVEREMATVRFPPTVVESFEDVLDEVVKIVAVSDDPEPLARLEEDVKDQCGHNVSASRSQPYYLDITHPDANKGAVVNWLSDRLDIPPGQMATIGDGPNDMLMFRLAGLSIAMGNARDEVRAAADEVTSSNDDEGFARAVETHILEISEGDAQ
jgi:Cof subfamily protein (haloacid dehalogenase superfamily)